MREIHGAEFTGRLTQCAFQDCTFEGCVFDNCTIDQSDSPSTRPILRNLVLHNCSQRACFLYSAAMEDVSISGLKKIGRIPLFLWGCVFKHVSLSGPISSLKINRFLAPGGDARQDEWDSDARQFYQSVDWALDISQADFQSMPSFEAIPGSLIRRDEDTQILLTRRGLRDANWQSFPFGNSSAGVAIEWSLQDSIFDDVVVAAPKKSKKFKEDLAALQMLRHEGLAT